MSKSKLFFGAITGLITAILASITAYIVAIRPWHLRWGSTDDEVDLPLPGDDLVPFDDKGGWIGNGPALGIVEVENPPLMDDPLIDVGQNWKG